MTSKLEKDIRFAEAISKVRGQYERVSDLGNDSQVITQREYWSQIPLLPFYRPAPRPNSLYKPKFNIEAEQKYAEQILKARQEEKARKFKLQALQVSNFLDFSSYHDNCIPANRKPQQIVSNTTQPTLTAAQLKAADVVTQDKIWKQSVENEKRGLRQWDSQWSYLTEYDSKGCTIEKQPMPTEEQTRFSEGPVPNTNSGLYGARVNSQNGQTIRDLEAKMAASNRKKKLDSEMICY